MNEVQQAFTAHLPLVNHIIRRTLERQMNLSGDTNWERRDERQQEAVCVAWQRFQLLYPTARDVTQAVKKAARQSVGDRFASTRKPGYVDALDRGACNMESPGTELLQHHAERDDTWIDWNVPEHLRSVARLLMQGFSRVEVAARQGVSPATITRRCEELESVLA